MSKIITKGIKMIEKAADVQSQAHDHACKSWAKKLIGQGFLLCRRLKRFKYWRPTSWQSVLRPA